MKTSLHAIALSFLFYLPLNQAAEYGHIHLAAPDVSAAVSWYAEVFGGTALADRVNFDGITVVFSERDPGPGSVGSGVDHIGFSMPDVPGKMAQAVAAGGKSLGDTRSFRDMTIGFVEDPWGTKIELIDDPERRGTHHLHLSTPDVEATLNWYQQMMGGEIKQFAGAIPGVDYSGRIWVLASRAQAEIAPTQGRSLDHLGWDVEAIDDFVADLKTRGVKVTLEPRVFRDIRIAFVEGPDGVRIELVQR